MISFDTIKQQFELTFKLISRKKKEPADEPFT